LEFTNAVPQIQQHTLSLLLAIRMLAECRPHKWDTVAISHLEILYIFSITFTY